jgi:hypothetical protein
MRKILLTAAATLALSGAAWADNIVVTATVDGSLVATETSADGNLNISGQAFGPVFNLNSLSINSQSFLAPPGLLSTNTLDVAQSATGNHQLVIDIVASGLAGPGAIEPLLSSFSVTGQSAGWTSSEETFINGVLFASAGFSGTSGAASFPTFVFVPNPIVAEAIYTINSVGSGSFNGGIDMSVAVATVPGPIVGAGLPGLISACFGMVGLARFRRRRAA